MLEKLAQKAIKLILRCVSLASRAKIREAIDKFALVKVAYRVIIKIVGWLEASKHGKDGRKTCSGGEIFSLRATELPQTAEKFG
ncbi:MAG: hypothetical protein AB4038_08990 [Prochloraceae cyanobacterium]